MSEIKRISLVVPEFYRDNRIFDEKNKLVNRDDCQRPFIELKKELQKRNIIISTVDQAPIGESDLVLFINIPDLNDVYLKLSIKNKKILYVIINELGLIHKNNLNTSMYHLFHKIFTYQDDLIDNDKFIKLNYSFVFPKTISRKDLKEKEKLCVIIAGNKKLDHPQELYSKRIEAIRWFEKKHPKEFDLFGFGWDEPFYFKNNFMGKRLNKIAVLRKAFTTSFPSYRGTVESKSGVLNRYSFSICYENACNVPGWITEKIFDCFMAGCVPIYWGANNINDHIPGNCFIDKRDFKDYQSLYSFIKSITDKEYRSYLDNIEKYIISKGAFPFTVKYFITEITSQILTDLNV